MIIYNNSTLCYFRMQMKPEYIFGFIYTLSQVMSALYLVYYVNIKS